MRYCPDNIGRDTIRRDEAYIAKLLLRVTPLHYLQKKSFPWLCDWVCEYTSRSVPQGVSLSTLLYLAHLSNVTTWITKCMLINHRPMLFSLHEIRITSKTRSGIVSTKSSIG